MYSKMSYFSIKKIVCVEWEGGYYRVRKPRWALVLILSFEMQSFKFDYFYFLLSLVLLASYLRNHWLMQDDDNLLLMFSFKGFTALALMLKSMVNFNFCIWCKLRVYLHSLACGHVVFPHCWKEVLSLLNGLGTLAENQLTIYVKVYYWAILCHWNICLSLCHIILFW